MNKHIVRHEDGTASTRNSANRKYTHAIEVGPVNPAAVIAADVARIEAYVTDAEARLVAFIASGKTVKIVDRNIHPRNAVDVDHGHTGEMSYHNFELRVGHHRGQHCNSKGESTKGYPEVTVISFEENCAAIEAGLINEVAYWTGRLVEAKATKPASIKQEWSVVTWCGRLDLAQKQLDKWSAIHAPQGCVVRIRETATP
jgi:hypothetical protein